MPSLLDKFISSPALWLGTYASGSVMTIVATNHAWGGQTAGYVAGFLILAGTIGYESLIRRITEENVTKKISGIDKTQSRILDDIADVQGALATLKNDVGSLEKNQSQIFAKTISKNSERAPLKNSPASFMPQKKPANLGNVKEPAGKNLRAIIQ